MRAVLLLTLITCLGGCFEPEVRTEYLTQTVTVTETYTPPVPTYVKIVEVNNQAGTQHQIHVRPFSWSSGGDRSFSGYSITSILVPAQAGKIALTSDNYPKCDDKMDGIDVQMYGPDGSKMTDGYWDGYHCTGEAKSYGFTIRADDSLGFGNR